MGQICPFVGSNQRIEYLMPRQDSNVVAAFTEDQVVHLTGISKGHLHYWDNTKFYRPGFAYQNRRAASSRVYSFRDVVCLRVLNAIRNEANVPLPRLRQVKLKLQHLGDDLWAKTTLYVLNRNVVFFNPETDRKEDVVSGQIILELPLKVVSGDMEKAVRRLHRRDKASIGRIERHRNVMSNQEVIAGTRIPVRSVKAFADAGYSIDAIQKEYPTLTRQDIQAAIKHSDAA